MMLTIQDVGVSRTSNGAELERAEKHELPHSRDKCTGVDRRSSRTPGPDKAERPLGENESSSPMSTINLHGAFGLVKK